LPAVCGGHRRSGGVIVAQFERGLITECMLPANESQRLEHRGIGTCRADVGAGGAIVNLNTKKKLVNGDAWAVICERLGKSKADGMSYPKADIIITTNKGDFVLTVAAEGQGNESWSKLIDGKLVAFNKQLDELKAATASARICVP
jgi:hypothetical protein